MKKIRNYLKVVYDEMVHKVSWPTWNDLQSSSIVVMVASLIIALLIFLMDTTFSELMKVVYNMFY
ncbi:MAG: preprotein translocase subunit SecE [Salinivirgaceae bacterium]|nr:preprotein translocase subunit SecE [Salinivirgaceae bacterium]MDD4746846.1 preprotein translocase subunit SecE [Salinivirgaceae bacterium]MDY0280145.1 preprotein translocase subunit SecE [Salinivirgaceae bacterium]